MPKKIIGAETKLKNEEEKLANYMLQVKKLQEELDKSLEVVKYKFIKLKKHIGLCFVCLYVCVLMFICV